MEGIDLTGPITSGGVLVMVISFVIWLYKSYLPCRERAHATAAEQQRTDFLTTLEQQREDFLAELERQREEKTLFREELIDILKRVA